MRNTFFRQIASVVLLAVALLFVPSTTNAQNRQVKKRAKTTVRKAAGTSQLVEPKTITPVGISERNIREMLFFPFSCLPDDMNEEEIQAQLSGTFGASERVNGYVGLHASKGYHYTYQDVPIGLCFYDCQDKRQWYFFYFDSRSEAEKFYADLAADIKKMGIPLVPDKTYGDLSNRTRPVSVFKWVYISSPEKVKEADNSNINGPDVVGKYVVELGVYKKK